MFGSLKGSRRWRMIRKPSLTPSSTIADITVLVMSHCQHCRESVAVPGAIIALFLNHCKTQQEPAQASN